MFIGRERELAIIEKKLASPLFEFGIIYGRRRVGKTRILQEIVREHGAIYYAANEMGYDYNLQQLSGVLAQHYGEPISFNSYEAVFSYMAQASQDKKTILILDEFTYLMASNSEIMSVMQNSIDQVLMKSQLKLIIAGSHVGMIEEALSYKKALYGRATFMLKIEPFDYYDAAKFYPGLSDEDKVRAYSIWGGIPFYANRINDQISIRENIIQLIIEDGAIFRDEIAFFLSQEVRSIKSYGKILAAIAAGASRLNEISNKSGLGNTGTVSNNIDTLIMLGLVAKETCFGEGANSRKTLYRIKDQLFNFHYSFIENKISQRAIMDADSFYDKFIADELDRYVSREFEQVCREFLSRKYRNQIEEISSYWYNDARSKENIEIDIMMRTDSGLYAYECKWTKDKVDMRILQKLQKKTEGINSDIKHGLFSKSAYSEDLVAQSRTDLESAGYYVPGDLYIAQI